MRIILIAYFNLFIVFLAEAQNNSQGSDYNPRLNTMIPQSPEAASLGKFGIFPVNLYTGMVNVSIPIAEIKTSKLSLPLSLSYNYNGCRPMEESNWIGLGWTLNGTGVITRIIKGKSDDDASVSKKWQDYANIVDLADNPDFLANVATGNIDTEPDIYAYNFGEQSGKFLLVGDKAFLFPKKDIIIIKSGNGFKIYNEGGNIYEFNDIETTSISPSAANSIPQFTSSWFLSKISSYDKSESISFTYTNWEHKLPNGNYSDQYTRKQGDNCNNGLCDTWSTSVAFGGRILNSKRLLRITASNTSIEFVPENTIRTDDQNSTNSFALKEINVYKIFGNELIKKVTFNHSYFGPTDNNGLYCKLKLSSVATTNYSTTITNGISVINSKTEPPYVLNYNNETEKFPKSTRGIDRWGFYNGVDNNITLFDNKLILNPPVANYYNSADRNVNFYKLITGTLNKITYPTGGYSEFTYENNMVRIPGKSDDILEPKQAISTAYRVGGTSANDSTINYGAQFDLRESQNITIEISRVLDGNQCDNPKPCANNHKTAKIYDIDPLYDYDDPRGRPPVLIYNSMRLGNSVISSTETLTLPQGRYLLSTTCDGNSLSATCKVNYIDRIINGYNGDPGPGLRIKSINSFDKINIEVALNKNYSYGKGATFIKPPLGYINNTVEYNSRCGSDYSVTNYSSEFGSSLSSLLSNQFFYKNVEEINKSDIINGKVSYEFESFEDANEVLLKKQTQYKYNSNEFQIVKETQNINGDPYNNQNTVAFFGLTTQLTKGLDVSGSCYFPIRFLSGGALDTVYREKLYSSKSYIMFSAPALLLSSKEINYELSSLSPVVSQSDFFYDNLNHLKPTLVKNIKSNGEILFTQTKFPLDYNISDCIKIAEAERVFINNRNNISNIYNNCRLQRSQEATPYITSQPNSENQPLLNILRNRKCENDYIPNYASVLANISNSSTTFTSCIDPSYSSEAFKSIRYLQKSNAQFPVEEIKSIIKSGSEYLILATKTDFNNVNVLSNSIALPKIKFQTEILQNPILKSNFILNPGNFYKPRIVFNYNNFGDINEQFKTNDVVQSYLYGYNHMYPIVEVLGASSNTISSFINQSILDNPTNDDALRNELNKIRIGLQNSTAFVKSYTYKPLIGLTSETDPRGKTKYYEYDNFNRLSLIRDQDNNVIKKICYNYAGQVEDCVPICDPTPNWQNTTTALRCKTDANGFYTGDQEQEQRNVNNCSSSFNSLRWVNIGPNTTACPISTLVSLTSQNPQSLTGFVASYYNINTGVTYNFNVSSSASSQPLGGVPVGNYNITISRPNNTNYVLFKVCFKNYSSTGYSASFRNVNVVSNNCNFISLTLQPSPPLEP